MNVFNENNIFVDERREKTDLDKYANYYVLLDFWMQAMEHGKRIELFLNSRGYHSIAIYGTLGLGTHLKTQLLNSNISIEYSIDRMNVDICGKHLSECYDMLPSVDAVIVTPVYDYGNIKSELNHYLSCNVISLEEVILSL